MRSITRLLVMASLIVAGLTASPYLTSLMSGSNEVGTMALQTTGGNTISGITYTNTSVTYMQSYSFVPSVAYSFSSISHTLNTGSPIKLSYDANLITQAATGFTINLSFTKDMFTGLTIRYLAIASNSTYFDVRLNSQSFSSTGTSVGNRINSVRTGTMAITYRNKSNIANAVVLFFTVGIDLAFTTSTFSYSLSNASMQTATYTLQITAQNYTGIVFLRICTINYQLLLLSKGDYSDILKNSVSTSGTVPQSVSVSAGNDLSVILAGLVDFSLNNSVTTLQFQIALSGNAFQVSGYQAMKTSYFWYRRIICPEGYYIDLTTSQCISCHYSCATCNNSQLVSQCLSCDSGNYRTQSGNYCLCQTNYLDIGLASCTYATCASTCLTCSNMDICSSCNATYHRALVLQACPCMDRYYDDSPNLPCLACNYSCLTCDSNTGCVTCSSAVDYRILDVVSNNCLCLTGYYDTGVTVCAACNFRCLTCSASSSCLTCDSTQQRYITPPGTGYCLCNTGYYDDGTHQQCATCPYYCSNCTSAAVCSACISTATRVLASGKCDCISTKYYDDLINAACQPCDYSCQACTNATACSLCNATNFRVLNTTLSSFCSCMPYYFQATPSTELCIICAATCLTCSTSAATGCLSCNSTSHRQIAGTGACVCSTGYYQTSSSVELCQACSYKCLTCTNNTQCATCNDDNMRQLLPATLCPCLDGYYDAGVQLCSKCNHKCLTCSSSSACLTCDSTTRDTSDLVNCPCKSGYFDDGVNSACVVCPSTCLTCNNFTACTSCNTTHNRTIDSKGNCICNSKTVDLLASFPVCQSCHYSCLTCSGITNTGCKTCDSAYFRQFSTGSCTCLEGYYDNGSAQLCVDCQYSCQTCTNGTNCTTCNAGLHRTFNAATGLCGCLGRYYDDSFNEICHSCHYSCLTCLDSLSCSSCNSSAYRVANASTGLCSCATDYLDNGVQQLCSICAYPCATCSLSTICLTCNSAYHRTFDGTASCPCDSGYYDNLIALCASCHYSCQTCDSASQCLTCSTTNHRTLDLYCLCDDGYYDQPSNPVCQSCPYSCLTCYNSSMCLTCDSSNHRLLSLTFTCDCVAGYYDSGVKLCSVCDPSCLTCTTSLACASCDSTIYRAMNATTSKCDCLAAYYPQVSSEVCLACNYTCGSCTATPACTGCSAANFRTLSGSLCICQDGYYDDGFSAACQPCQHSCQTCTSRSSCLLCNATKMRSFSAITLTCICADRYYDDGISQTCQGCHYSCATCQNSSSCLTCDILNYRLYNSTTGRCQCQLGYYNNMTNETCVQCDSSCVTCSNGSSCDTCNLTQFRKSTPATAGLCQCLDGYYNGVQPVCQPCYYSCLTCSVAVNCLTCDAAQHRVANGTQCSCMTGYFDTQTNTASCAACSTKCLTCSGSAGHCLTCNAADFRVMSVLTSNTCDCMAHYYDDGTNVQCASCLSSCATCNNPTGCQTCNLTANRYMAVGSQCACLAGYYDVANTEACSACNYTCGSCTNATDCVSCPVGSHRTQLGATCPCDQHYYDDLSSKICKSCLYQCSTCSSGTVCLSCNSTNNRVRNTTTSRCDCVATYYDDQLSNQLCLKCHYSCLDCHNSSACFSCNSADHRAILSVSLLCSCTAGYYDDGTNNPTCQPCILGCLTCTNSSGCIGCNGTDFRVANLTSKQCECKSGYYSNGNSLCAKCHYTCQTCSSSSACINCNATYFRALSGSFTCDCMAGTYDDGSHMLCLACHYTCQTCTVFTSCLTCSSANHRVSSATYCTCSQGYYDDGNNAMCQTCSASCLTCSIAANNCTSCDPVFHRIVPNCDCAAGYYSVTGVSICSQCHHSCATCTSSARCDTCNTTKHRTLPSLGLYCTCLLDGYYDDGVSQLCLQCNYSCYQCTGPASCTNCSSVMHRVSAPANQCACDVKYYDDGTNQLCQACHYSCESCLSQYCDGSCNSTLHRQANAVSRLCDCSEGYYSYNNKQSCLMCNPSCKSCSDGLSCDSCYPTNFRVLVAGANVLGVVNPYCSCVDRYYPITASTCSPCHLTCFMCNGPSATQCTYCSAAAHRQLFNQTCVCSLNYYDDGTNELCQACHTSCSKCTTPANSTCSACVSPYFLQATTCYSVCPLGYYGNSTTNTCSLCGSNCDNCTNSTVCTICSATYYLQTSTCVAACSVGYYASSPAGVATCSLCHTNCTSCASLTVCTGCTNQFYLFNGNCLPCNSACNGCTGPNPNQCTSCFYPLYLKASASLCITLNCESDEYVDPLLGCLKCSSLIANSYSCNNTAAFSCQLGYKLANSTNCALCSTVPGYYIDTSKKCSEVCGDGLRFELPCDDGNGFDGDGCSSSCQIENGWTCTNGSPSLCTLTSTPEASIYSQQKIAGRNQIAVYIQFSIDLRLGADNFIFKYQGREDPPKETTPISLQKYKIVVEYHQTIQKQTAQLVIKFFSHSRRLLTSASYLNLSFPFDVSTYPPAVYYEPTSINNVDRLLAYCRVISIATLVLSCLACLMLGKTVNNALQALNFIALLFITQGYSLNSATDWTQFIIVGLKEASLLGGFTAVECSTCISDSAQLKYGYQPLFSQNAGAVFSIDMVLLGIFGLISFIQSILTKHQLRYPFLSKLKLLLRYYSVAFLLGFNVNLIFSAVLSLRYPGFASPVQIGNFVLALLALILHFTFTLLLFRWGRQLNSQYVHPLEITSGPTAQNQHPRKSVIADSLQSAVGGIRQQELKEQDSPTKSPSAPKEFDRDRELVLSFDLSSQFRESKAASYYHLLNQLRIGCVVVLIAVMQQEPVAKTIMVLVINSAYLLYAAVVRPFNTLLNNVRLLVLEGMLEALLIMDVAACSLSLYSFGLEVLLIIIICVSLLCNILVLVVQMVQANQSWLNERLRPWMMNYRSKKKYGIENKQRVGADSRMRLEEKESGAELQKTPAVNIIGNIFDVQNNQQKLDSESGTEVGRNDFFEKVLQKKRLRGNLVSKYRNDRRFRTASGQDRHPS